MVSSRTLPDAQAIQRMADRYPELDIPSVQACLAFLDTTTVVYEALEAYFTRHGLSMGKFTLLMQLFQADGQGMTPSEFAERVGVTRATITSLLDGLERDTLVTRQPHPVDRRMLQVYLTEKGRSLIADILPDHFCRTTGLMGHLSDREKKTLIKLLGKLQSGISALEDFSDP
ncbi:MAG: MarR family transcriptional regulator [Oculatellaceae cyanobacterium Prado106]|jgi:DNA-binding MarR family transcriptional regulator|nr:MarR family transcriptional regulator [Oculatellaceae cyanobacterium Prado106]